MIQITDDHSCFISFFEEAEEFLKVENELIGVIRQGKKFTSVHEAQLLWLSQTVILHYNNEKADKYQEQPHLLDPHLSLIIEPCITLLKSLLTADVCEKLDKDFCNRVGPIFKILYIMCKTRGYKTIVKFFTHEASDLEPILEFTEAVAFRGIPLNYWEIPYVLLLWLSLVVMIPFDLRLIDTEEKDKTIMERLIYLSKHYLHAVGKEYESSCLLLTRIVTRHDVASLHLSSTLDYCFSTLLETTDTFQLRGILHALCMIYKYGQRSLLLPTLSKSHDSFLLMTKPQIISNSLLRKLLTKLSQRIALCYMKPRMAKWRYQRGFRSLEANLNPDSAFHLQETNENEETIDEQEFDDIPEVIEDIIDMMMQGLQDKDTIVRWQCAKGIGRIANRLPKVLANDIITAIQAILKEDVIGTDLRGVSDSSWHGSCLALVF